MLRNTLNYQESRAREEVMQHPQGISVDLLDRDCLRGQWQIQCSAFAENLSAWARISDLEQVKFQNIIPEILFQISRYSNSQISQHFF